MGYDNRFPHMHRVANAPNVGWTQRARLVRLAARICSRTGLRCSYDAARKGLFFHYHADPSFGPLRLPAFNEDGTDRIYSDVDIDEAVRYVQYGRMPKSMKDRLLKQAEKAEKDAKEHAIEKHLDERRPSAVDYAAFLDKKRRGLTKVISA